MSQQTVLVIGDDPDITAMLLGALESEGYRLALTSGTTALSVAQQLQPNLILLDMMLSGRNAPTLCKQLRADPATASIPIVVLFATTSLAAYGDLAVDALLAKPFTVLDLYAKVAAWIAPARAEAGGGADEVVDVQGDE